MNLLIACAQQAAWCDFAQGRLREMGVRDPLPSERTALNAFELTSKMLAAQGSHNQRNGREPNVIGRAWEVAAADIIVANAEQDIWGWCDQGNLNFLDFWRDFEPSSHFVLAFSSPAESLAFQFDGKAPDASELEHAIEQWIEYHYSMLNFFHANTDRAILTHVQKFEGSAISISDALSDRFGLAVFPVSTEQSINRSALQELIALHGVNGHHEALALYDELNNSADLPAMIGNSFASSISAAAARELSEIRAYRASLGQDLAIAEERIASLSSELEALRTSFQQKEQELDSLRKRAESVEDSRAERELLELQLKQVQEELEHYFSKYQALKTAKSPSSARNIGAENQRTGALGEQPRKWIDGPISLDLRSYIDGQGWHSPEPHGRWAGAASTSSLRLPRFARKDHQVILRVVDAISLEHLRGIKLKVNGSELPTSLKILSDMGGRLAPLRRLKATYSNVAKPYPAEVRARIPATLLGDSSDQTRIEVSSLPPVSPTENGEADTRMLSVCIEKIEISGAD